VKPPRSYVPIFIIDENMGSSIVDLIVGIGGRATLLTNHVARGTEDVTFIPELGKWGDSFLTRDVSMRSNKAERSALLLCDVHVFLIGGGGLGLDDLQALIRDNHPAMERYVNKYARPFLAKVTNSGITVATKSGRRGGVKK
jgi:hypothetical protein